MFFTFQGTLLSSSKGNIQFSPIREYSPLSDINLIEPGIHTWMKGTWLLNAFLRAWPKSVSYLSDDPKVDEGPSDPTMLDIRLIMVLWSGTNFCS
jgi:hypothetical protein